MVAATFALFLLINKPIIMKFKSTLLAAICCLCSLSAFAHRDYFYSYSFTEELADGWTLAGGQGESADGMFIVTGDGSGNITYSKTFDEAVAVPNLEGAYVTIVHQGNENTKLKVVLTGADNSTCTLSSDAALANDAELTNQIYVKKVESGSVPAAMKKISIVLDGSNSETLCVVSSLVVQSAWNYPTLPNANETVRIEAEDFDEGGMDVGYSSVRKSTTTTYRKDNPYLNIVGITNNTDIYSGGFAIADCGETWDSYNLDEPLTVKSATKNWGQWTKYTINVEQDCDVDITVGAGCSLGSYQIISVLGNHASMNIVWEDLGCPFNWVARYSGSWVLSVDDVNIRGTQTKNFSYGGGGEDKFEAALADPNNFHDTQLLINGNKVNNDTVWVWPTKNNVSNTYTTWTAQTFDKPHYENVHLTKGTHVIKVQSLASQWCFDFIDIKTKNVGGVESNVADKADAALKVYPNPATDVVTFASVPVEFVIFNVSNGAKVLEGNATKADVSALANGIYAVRTQDGKVAKFIKK